MTSTHTRPLNATRPPLLMVFGRPRSGTSWLGKIFDSHPGTVYLHEPDSTHVGDPLGRIPLHLGEEHSASYEPRLKAFVDELPQISSVRVRGKLPIFSKSHRRHIGNSLFKAKTLGAKAIARVNGDAPLFDAAPGAMLVWKSVESAGRLPVLLEALPDSRCIYVVRHPCGWVASVRRGDHEAGFSGQKGMADDVGVFAQLINTPLARRLGITLEDIMMEDTVARLAWSWLLGNEQTLAHFCNHPRVMIVKYEDICERPLEMSRDMFRFAGLAWHPQTADFLKASTTIERKGYFSIYKNSTHAAQRWREEMSPAELQTVKKILRKGCATATMFGFH